MGNPLLPPRFPMSPFAIDNINIIPAGSLGEDDVTRWADYYRQNAFYYGVSLHPSFTQLVSEAISDVFVVRLQHSGTTVGYMPVSRDARGCGHPAGRWLMSFQGIVCDRRYRVCPSALLASTGMKRVVFDRCVDAQRKRPAGPFLTGMGR